MPDNNKNNYDYDLGDMIDSAVQFGTQVGSSVLGSIADALEQKLLMLWVASQYSVGKFV